MKKYEGKSVYKGIAMGPLPVMKKADDLVKRSTIEDAEAEINRVSEAIEVSKALLRKLYDKALKEVGEAHAAGKWAGICGELGADLELTEEFIQMGVDELSVAPSMVLKVRQCVREMKVY